MPQLLLSGFATEKRKQLYVLDKRTESVFRSSIRNLACERGFYDLHSGTGTPDRVDRWLGELEGNVGPVVRSIRTRRTLHHLVEEERQWLAAFIAVQHVRTRRHREVWADINRKMAAMIREMGTEPNSVANFREFTGEEARELSVGDVPRAAFTLIPHILSKSWLLLAAPTGTEFWIGDHPIMLANNMNPGDGFRSTSGFAVPGVEIYLPVSSELILGCLCPSIQEMFVSSHARLERLASPATKEIGEYLNAFAGTLPKQLDSENVKYQNSLQALGAERFVFSQHRDFTMLLEMIHSDPTLKTGPRVEILGGPKRAE